jgi:transposase
MVESKNRRWKNKSKTTIRQLYVLWQRLQRQRFGLPKLLESIIKQMNKTLDKISTIFELRRVDKMMKERAMKQQIEWALVEKLKKEFPEVWDNDQDIDWKQWLNDNPTEGDK